MNNTMSSVDLSPILSTVRRPIFAATAAATGSALPPGPAAAPALPPGPLAAPVLRRGTLTAAALPVGPAGAAAQPPGPLAPPVLPLGPTAAGGAAPPPRRRRRLAPPVMAPQSAESVGDMAREKMRNSTRIADETIRLLRLSHRAAILAAKQEAKYWAAKRQIMVGQAIAEGQEVSVNINTDDIAACPLMSGTLDAAVNPAVGDRSVKILTVLRIFLDHLTVEVFFASLNSYLPIILVKIKKNGTFSSLSDPDSNFFYKMLVI